MARRCTPPALAPCATGSLLPVHEVVLPGLIKLVTVKKPAVPAREGINPFTGQPAVFKAKPASKVVKARPVKQLKDAIK